VTFATIKFHPRHSRDGVAAKFPPHLLREGAGGRGSHRLGRRMSAPLTLPLPHGQGRRAMTVDPRYRGGPAHPLLTVDGLRKLSPCAAVC
jgi:hypothetical protein